MENRYLVIFEKGFYRTSWNFALYNIPLIGQGLTNVIEEVQSARRCIGS